MRTLSVTLCIVFILLLSGCGNEDNKLMKNDGYKSVGEKNIETEQPLKKKEFTINKSSYNKEELVTQDRSDSNIAIEVERVDDNHISIKLADSEERDLQGVTLHITGFNTDEGVNISTGDITAEWMNTQNYLQDKKEFIMAMITLESTKELGEIAVIELSEGTVMPENIDVWAEVADKSQEYKIGISNFEL